MSSPEGLISTTNITIYVLYMNPFNVNAILATTKSTSPRATNDSKTEIGQARRRLSVLSEKLAEGVGSVHLDESPPEVKICVL